MLSARSTAWLGGALLADNNHAAAGIAGWVQAEWIVPWFFCGIARFGYHPVSLASTGFDGFGVALVPR